MVTRSIRCYAPEEFPVSRANHREVFRRGIEGKNLCPCPIQLDTAVMCETDALLRLRIQTCVAKLSGPSRSDSSFRGCVPTRSAVVLVLRVPGRCNRDRLAARMPQSWRDWSDSAAKSALTLRFPALPHDFLLPLCHLAISRIGRPKRILPCLFRAVSMKLGSSFRKMPTGWSTYKNPADGRFQAPSLTSD